WMSDASPRSRVCACVHKRLVCYPSWGGPVAPGHHALGRSARRRFARSSARSEMSLYPADDDGSSERAVAPEFPDLPEATVARLPEYLRALHHLAEAGHETVSSEGLAAAAGVNSAKLRKGLSQLGSYGTRGVGYDVAVLVGQMEYVLGLTQRRSVALIGIGNLGHALAGYAGFAS